MAYELASAFVSVGTRLSGLSAGLTAARQMVTRSLAGLTSLIGKLGAIGGGLSLGFAVKLASDAQEMGSMFDAVFKEQSAGASKFAEEFATRIGRSVNEVKGQMANFQDTFVPLGFARDEAAELSMQLTKVTADLASFKNKSDAAVAHTLTSALTGEREALKGLGIVIQEVDVKNELLRMGMQNATGDALKQAKAQATLNLIMKNSADAAGDAEKTAGSFANRLKGLTGAAKDVAADIGSALLPALANMAKKATDAIRSIQPRIKALAGEFAAWGHAVTTNWDKTWELIKNTVNLTWEFIKSVFLQFPKFWGFINTKMMLIAFQAGARIGKFFIDIYNKAFDAVGRNWLLMVETVLIPGGTLMALGAANAMAKAASKAMQQVREGAEGEIKGMKLTDLWESTPGLDAALEKQKTFLDDLKKAKDAFDEANKDKAQAMTPDEVRAKKMIVDDMSLKSGFLDFADANRQIQDALLKQAAPEEKMLGELQAGNDVARSMQKTLIDIEANTGAAGAIPVAT